MGKSFFNNKSRLQELTKSASEVLGRTTTKQRKPTSQTRKVGELQVEGKRLKKMESSSGTDNNNNEHTRVPLSEVVSDCVKRWFKDTLKEAKAGDINMQVLVGQMYHSGYGVAQDTQKGRMWMTRASRTRSSVWKVSDKHPGYNASDSDSDEL